MMSKVGLLGSRKNRLIAGIAACILVLLPFTCIRLHCDRAFFPPGMPIILGKHGMAVQDLLLLGVYVTVESRAYSPGRERLSLASVVRVRTGTPIANRDERAYGILYPLLLTSDVRERLLVGYFVVAPNHHSTFFWVDNSLSHPVTKVVWTLDPISEVESVQELRAWLKLLGKKELAYSDIEVFKDADGFYLEPDKGFIEYNMQTHRMHMAVDLHGQARETAGDYINSALARYQQ